MTPEQKRAQAQRLRDLQAVFKHFSDDRNALGLHDLPAEVEAAADRIAELDGAQTVIEIFRHRPHLSSLI